MAGKVVELGDRVSKVISFKNLAVLHGDVMLVKESSFEGKEGGQVQSFTFLCDGVPFAAYGHSGEFLRDRENLRGLVVLCRLKHSEGYGFSLQYVSVL